MTTQHLQHAIEAAQPLSPREKYELIEVIARSLVQADALEARSTAFLRGRTLDELIAEQQPPIIDDISLLAADFWPEDESADDINAYIEAQRHANREPLR
ncbi:MAG: hypothetical protein ACJ8CR_24205 [Roseiflexaceae bacterium]